MGFHLAPLALTWNDLERSKSRSHIFQTAVSWKRWQIQPNLLLLMDRKSNVSFHLAPLALTWNDLERSKSRSVIFCICYVLYVDRAKYTTNHG